MLRWLSSQGRRAWDHVDSYALKFGIVGTIGLFVDVGLFNLLCYGPFAGATAAALCVVAVMPLAIWFGTLMPWVDPEKVGAFHLTHYLYVLFAFALPSVLIISAGYFAIATATRSMMATYVGVIVTLVLYLAFRILLRDPQYDVPVALADPFGVSALRIATSGYVLAEGRVVLSGTAEQLANDPAVQSAYLGI